MSYYDDPDFVEEQRELEVRFDDLTAVHHQVEGYDAELVCQRCGMKQAEAPAGHFFQGLHGRSPEAAFITCPGTVADFVRLREDD